MKKPKSLEVKLRSAIRLIWSRSAERKAILKTVLYKDKKTGHWMFRCEVCGNEWHEAMAQIDHNPPIGSLHLDDLSNFVHKMFFGPQRVVDKLCHKKITYLQRRKK